MPEYLTVSLASMTIVREPFKGFDVRNVEHMDALMHIFVTCVHNFFNVTITRVQAMMAREILYRSLLRKRHTIDISACRQIGKTELVCYCTWFLSYMFPMAENEYIRFIITAPEKGTGSEVYDRTKKLYDHCEAQHPTKFLFRQKNLDQIVLADSSKLEVFGLYKGFANREDKKTTKEGRTAHVIIRDEKHLGDDEIFKDEVEPAMSTTGGVDIWIGNGGFRTCRAKELADLATAGQVMTVLDDVTIFRFDYDFMRREMIEEHKRTDNPMFLRWIESQDKYIADHGRDSDEVLKNLYLKWIVEVGNFTSWENLISHRREALGQVMTRLADVGIDFAKGENGDETVVTITDYERNIRTWEVFKGEYPDQVEEIVSWLPQAAAEHGVTLRFIFCDTTGVGDPVKTMLKRRLRIPCRGVVFTVQNKDIMAKKLQKAWSASKGSERLTYPMEHKHRAKFETQMKGLQKERRPSGQLNLTHGTAKNDHDDFPQSLMLSLWNIEKIRGQRGGEETEQH